MLKVTLHQVFAICVERPLTFYYVPTCSLYYHFSPQYSSMLQFKVRPLQGDMSSIQYIFLYIFIHTRTHSYFFVLNKGFHLELQPSGELRM